MSALLPFGIAWSLWLDGLPFQSSEKWTKNQTGDDDKSETSGVSASHVYELLNAAALPEKQTKGRQVTCTIVPGMWPFNVWCGNGKISNKYMVPLNSILTHTVLLLCIFTENIYIFSAYIITKYRFKWFLWGDFKFQCLVSLRCNVLYLKTEIG